MASESLDAAAVGAFVRRFAAAVAANRDLLTELDTAVGDGDHGTNLDRGMAAAVVALDEGTGGVGGVRPDTPGGLLTLVGRRLVSTVGGASGALYGTAFLRAGGAAGTGPELTAKQVAAALRAATDGIAQRGKCVLDDKTMYDVWEPATAAVEQAVDGGRPLAEALSAGAAAAAAAVTRTAPLQARRGRASYLGERSVGHRDPGSVSSQLLFAALANEPTDVTGPTGGTA
jgi:dihydroxyacetone kinase-like protein